MKKIYSIKYIVLFLAVFLSFGNLKAQEPQYTIALDTNIIVIGDQINLSFKAVVPDEVELEFPALKDSIVSGIEIINKGTLKSKSLDNNLKELLLEYKITAFDTGLYVIPSYQIHVKHKGYNNVVRTEPLQLGVTTFKVDTSKGYADVVAPKEAPINFAEIMPFFLWGLLGVVLLALGFYIFKKWKSKESIFFVAEKPKEPAHIIAFRDLDRLKKEKLWESGNIKEFHSQVTEALRVYVENQFDISAMEQTSVEILDEARKEPLLNERLVEKLEDILLRADFVKFAKAEPLGNENQQSLDYAYDIVTLSHKAVVDKAAYEKANQDENQED